MFVENMAMYYARRKKVPDLLEAVQQEPVCKVALFCKNAAETNVLPYYRQMFDDKLQVALSGADWVDLMRLGLSKGVAVGVMCDNLHITPAQCMAFGDYLNDAWSFCARWASPTRWRMHMSGSRRSQSMFVHPMMRTARAARSAAYWRWNKRRNPGIRRIPGFLFELGCICILFWRLEYK